MTRYRDDLNLWIKCQESRVISEIASRVSKFPPFFLNFSNTLCMSTRLVNSLHVRLILKVISCDRIFHFGHWRTLTRWIRLPATKHFQLWRSFSRCPPRLKVIYVFNPKVEDKAFIECWSPEQRPFNFDRWRLCQVDESWSSVCAYLIGVCQSHLIDIVNLGQSISTANFHDSFFSTIFIWKATTTSENGEKNLTCGPINNNSTINGLPILRQPCRFCLSTW